MNKTTHTHEGQKQHNTHATQQHKPYNTATIQHKPYNTARERHMPVISINPNTHTHAPTHTHTYTRKHAHARTHTCTHTPTHAHINRQLHTHKYSMVDAETHIIHARKKPNGGRPREQEARNMGGQCVCFGARTEMNDTGPGACIPVYVCVCVSERV